MGNPDVEVWLGDGSGDYGYDVTQYLDLQQGISIARGRQDQFSSIAVGTASLTLDNNNGMFSPKVSYEEPTVLRTNLVLDPSCTKEWGWTLTDGDLSVTGSAGLYGTGGFNLLRSAAGTGDIVLTPVATDGLWPATAGLKYTFAIWARTSQSAADGRTWRVKITWYNSGGGTNGSIQSAGVAVPADGTWTRVSTNFTAPANTVAAAGEVTVEDVPQFESHWCDAFLFEQATTVLDYFDGSNVPAPLDGTDFTRYVWTGDPHNSTSQQVTNPGGPWQSMPIQIRATADGVTTNRFTGFVTSWEPVWPNGGKHAEVHLQCADLLSLLSRRTMLSVSDEELAHGGVRGGPVCFYPLNEREDADGAYDISERNNLPLTIEQRGSGGTLTWDDQARSTFAGGNSATFTRADTANGQYLMSAWSNTDAPYRFCTPSNPDYFPLFICLKVWTATAGLQTFLRIGHIDSYGLEIRMNAAGKLEAACWQGGSGGTSTFLIADTNAMPLSAWNTINMSITPLDDQSGNVDVRLYLNLSQVASNSSTTTPVTDYTLYIGGAAQSGVGNTTSTEMATASICDVAIFQEVVGGLAVHEDQYDAFNNGFRFDDSATTRITRLVARAVQDRNAIDLDFEPQPTTSEVDWEETAGRTAYECINSVATATEGGVFYADGDGALVVQGRTHRYSVAPAHTFDAHDTGTDTTFVTDDQLLANKVEVSARSFRTVVAANQASIERREQYLETLTTVHKFSEEAAYLAQWRVNAQGEPQPHPGAVTVDLLTQPDATQQAIQALDVSDLIAIENLPEEAPATTVRLFIEGWQEVIGFPEWSMQFNTSNETPVWTLDDDVLGVLDTNGNILGY